MRQIESSGARAGRAPTAAGAASMAVLLAVVLLPAWGTGSPPVDWAQLPAEPVEVLTGTSVVRCSEFEPILCVEVEQDGVPGRGGIEHLAFPLETMPDLAGRLGAGASVRAALEAHADDYHRTFAEDRAAGCPPAYRYVPDPTTPALVAGQPGVRYAFTVLDGEDAVVERVITFAALRDDALQLFVASALAEGACLEDIGYNFASPSLATFEPAFAQLVARAQVPPPPGARQTLAVPVGGDGVTYDEPDGEGELAAGPSAIALDARGTAWIVDVEGGRLVRVSADGGLLEPVDLTAHGVSSMMDLDVRGDGFALLDMDRSGAARVLLLDGGGAVTASVPLPGDVRLEDGLTGLAVVDDGVVLAELEGGARLHRVVDADGRPADAEAGSYRLHGRSYTLRPARAGRAAAVAVDGRAVEIRTDHPTVAVQLLGAAPDGAFWVVVEELGPELERISVDRTVRRYDPSGRLLGSDRDDLAGRHTVVEHPFALTADGTAVVLRTGVEAATVVPLRPSVRLQPLLPPAEPVQRLLAAKAAEAVDAVGGAIALSVEAHPAGSGQGALLARDDVFADALASGGLQGVRDVPLLYTGADALDQRVLAELRRLGAQEVTVLGGTAAVSPAVVAALEDQGFRVARVGGATRIETAVAVARVQAAQARRVVLVRASGSEGSQAFADALAAGALAAAAGDPVVLTGGDRLAPPVQDYLVEAGVRQVVVAGGTAAVSEHVARQVQDLGIAVVRAGGAERAATAVALASLRAAPTGAYADAVVLVDGRTWQDGLASASLSTRRDAPVLLADGTRLPAATAAFLRAAEVPPALVCTPSVRPAACSAAAAAAGHTGSEPAVEGWRAAGGADQVRVVAADPLSRRPAASPARRRRGRRRRRSGPGRRPAR